MAVGGALLGRVAGAARQKCATSWRPEPQDRDRRYKPGLYADAGIRHLWRIEDENGLPAVHTYELDDTTRAYVATGVHRDRLVAPVPFPVSVDVTGLVR